MNREIWITGIGLVTSQGEGREAHWAALTGGAKPAVDAAGFAPFPVHPLPPLTLDTQIPRKGDQRQMEPWQRLGTYAAGLAIDDAGARGLVSDMHLVVAAGGGERDIGVDEAIASELAELPEDRAAPLLNQRLANGLRPTLFLAQLSNLLAGNISIVHGVTGSSRTFMGEESAAADALRIAHARLAEGRGEIALVGGALVAQRWDMVLLYAPGGGLLQGGFAPVSTRDGGGAVMGGMAAFLVLEHAEHARARGARGIAKLAGVASDASRRAAAGDSAAAARALLAKLPVADAPLGVMSGETGAAPATAEEEAFLAGLPNATVRRAGSVIGHGIEAGFPTQVALGAIALDQGGFYPPLDPADTLSSATPRQVLVTGFGIFRGEALALLEPVAPEDRA
ncbi:beta-ketoacyl-ACP synthase [Roseomonas hellenica]|uniref:Beta-ketoacyl-ACP synthase n=1 Tax=Plastoroseomonas hellenica TaxID=2687306 RepID=A0ABS5F6P5_9PROT|nr:beta-ketoacyl-ACP synthase [Plastoroseomonas hellenica]MBR0668214.1 beta-ketoacyl-ACP synthase [Plastoroseomonas hellenica]